MGLGTWAGWAGFSAPGALGGKTREGGTVVQTGGVVQGANTIPRRGRLNALLALAVVVAIAALVALLLWVLPPATSSGGAEDVVPMARPGSGIVHDDAGSVHTGLAPGYAVVHDDAANLPAPVSAAVHDDAGKMHR